ncbi:MAG: hypothetical protein Q9178_001451 [Gyalolechia marmorata]
MPQSIHWHAWSGFTGEGTYVILNKASLTCLDLEEGSKEPGTEVQGFTHIPNNSAQLWDIHKRREADIYYIECKGSATVLTASGYVLDLHHGKAANGTLVELMQERGLSDEMELQKWLLQVQLE